MRGVVALGLVPEGLLASAQLPLSSKRARGLDSADALGRAAPSCREQAVAPADFRETEDATLGHPTQTEGLKTALRQGNPSRTLSICPSLLPRPSGHHGPSRGLTPDSQGEGLRLSNPCPRPRGFSHPGVPAQSWVLVRRCCRTCSRRRACPGSGRRPRRPRRRGREGRGRWGPRAGRERLPEGAGLRAAPRGLRARGCVYRDWRGCHLHAVTERGRSRVKAQTQGDPAPGFLPARFRSPEVPPQAPGTPRPRSRAAGSWSTGGGQRAALLLKEHLPREPGATEGPGRVL